ncbi:MAG: FHA domain-containing protein [Proteobacteria bacterium]|nr:FHA domain-containing protein [Pseudomonadota bacterium]
MPTLTLTFKDNTIATYRLEKGQSLTIGRKESNDIPIENLAVSGHHAKIDSVGEGFLLTDLQSKNGSFVNNELVSSHWLKEGDNIHIGKHTLVFTYAEGEDKPAEGMGEMDQTMIMDTDKYRDMLAKAIPKAVAPEAAQEPVGILSYLAGGEGEIKLTKKLTKIGKSSSSDIVVSGLWVGATAATISKRPKGYSLSYVDGMAKPKVNGETVKESVALKEFDIIEIGSIKLQFVSEKQ